MTAGREKISLIKKKMSSFLLTSFKCLYNEKIANKQYKSSNMKTVNESIRNTFINLLLLANTNKRKNNIFIE